MTDSKTRNTAADRLIQTLVSVLVGAGGVAVVIGLWMLISDNQGSLTSRLLFSALITTGYTLAAIVAALLARRGVATVLMLLAILTCYVAVVTWVSLIWFEHRLSMAAEDDFARAGATATVISIGLLYTALYAMMKTKSVALSMLRWGVIGIAWLFGFIVIFLIWFLEWLDGHVPQAVLLTIVSVAFSVGGITAISSLVIRALFRANERREKAGVESVLDRPRLELTCPRCEAEQTLPAGPVRCTACGFTMNIEVDEPRCECGYLLFRLVGDRCPECGAAVSRVGAEPPGGT